MTMTSSRVLAGFAALVLASTCLSISDAEAARQSNHRQPRLESRGAPIISVGRLTFRDLDRNGKLTPYEDWRLTPQRRAADLVGRMTLAQKAGQLVHGSLGNAGTSYNTADFYAKLHDEHITT